MEDKELKKIVRREVELELEKIDNILEDIDQSVLSNISTLIAEEIVLDKIIALVREEVKRQI